MGLAVGAGWWRVAELLPRPLHRWSIVPCGVHKWSHTAPHTTNRHCSGRSCGAVMLTSYHSLATDHIFSVGDCDLAQPS